MALCSLCDISFRRYIWQKSSRCWICAVLSCDLRQRPMVGLVIRLQLALSVATHHICCCEFVHVVDLLAAFLGTMVGSWLMTSRLRTASTVISGKSFRNLDFFERWPSCSKAGGTCCNLSDVVSGWRWYWVAEYALERNPLGQQEVPSMQTTATDK